MQEYFDEITKPHATERNMDNRDCSKKKVSLNKKIINRDI